MGKGGAEMRGENGFCAGWLIFAMGSGGNARVGRWICGLFSYGVGYNALVYRGLGWFRDRGREEKDGRQEAWEIGE